MKIKENTHLVIKRKLINERLCKKDRELFYALLDLITKENYNEYIICNKDEPYCRINDGEDLNCEENPNCYFKQLKRKEQECEELNSDNRYFVNKIISLELLTDKYKQAIGKIEDIADDYNRVEKTSQYYRDGFDEIQNIIDEIKE